MREEKQNNKLGETLDSIDALPEGFSFNSQRVWDHLENTLPRRKNKRKLTWYAAASVALLMGAGYITWVNQKDIAGIQEKNVAIAEKTLKENNAEQDKVKTTAAVAVAIPIVHHQPKKKTERAPAHAEEIKPVLSNPITTSVSADTKTGILPPQPAAEQISSTTVLPAEEKKKAAMVVAKKAAPRPYRIVHLNDLDAMPAPAQSTLSKSEFKKLMQQQNDDKEVERGAEASPHPLLFLKKQVSTNTLSDNF